MCQENRHDYQDMCMELVELIVTRFPELDGVGLVPSSQLMMRLYIS